MGAISFSIDLSLVNCCKKALPLNIFLETGTFTGDSIQTIQSLFREIHSIELSETYYEKAVTRFKTHEFINLYQGDSVDWLRRLHPQLSNQSTLYWLDAHWCVAEDTAGLESQCPLLDELTAIESLNAQSIILIDDARLFLCTPPSPHKISQWPSCDQVIKTLYSLSSIHSLMVVNDVIIFYPQLIDEQIKNYAYTNGIDWLVVLNNAANAEQILKECEAKEEQIQLLATVAEERLQLIERLTADLQQLKQSKTEPS